MKKNIFLSLGLSASILVSSCFSVPFVSAEAMNNEQISNLLESFIEQNYKGDARVFEENDFLHVEFRKTGSNQPGFDAAAISEDFDQFFKENNIDSSKVVIGFLEGTAAASPDTDKITDLEQIAALLKKYIDENHPGDAAVVFEEDGYMHVTFRKTAIGEKEFDSDGSIWRNMAKYLEENNVDPSYISNDFKVEFLDAAPAAVVSAAATGDIDLNDTIDVTDLTELSLALIGDKEISDDQQKAADIDGDGAVTLADLARLQQYLSKKIDSLG